MKNQLSLKSLIKIVSCTVIIVLLSSFVLSPIQVSASTTSQKAISAYKKQIKNSNGYIYKYAIVDVTGDGIPEMITSPSNEGMLCVYIYYDGKVKLAASELGGCSGSYVYYNKKKHTVLSTNPENFEVTTNDSLDLVENLTFSVIKVKKKSAALYYFCDIDSNSCVVDVGTPDAYNEYTFKPEDLFSSDIVHKLDGEWISEEDFNTAMENIKKELNTYATSSVKWKYA